METKEMFQLELIDLHMSVETEEELFEQVASRLQQKGYVNGGYLEGIKSREKRFPTGLMTEFLNVALPHSDTEFIEKPFIYVARIKNPVIVKQMGDDQEMEVQNFFFLGIKEPSKQVGLLQELMTMFQNSQFISALKEAKQNEKFFDLLMDQFI